MHGSAEPPDLDLALMFHAVPFQSERPIPESLSSIVIVQPSSEAGAKPQTICNVVHLLSSC